MRQIFKKVVAHRRSSTALRFLAAGGFVLVVAGGIALYNERIAARDHATTDTEWSLIARPITARDHTIGDIAAPIQLVVFADFQCQYCGRFFQTTLPQLQKNFGKQIVVAYRHLPLPHQPAAQPEAEASECVFQLGGNVAFWHYANLIYAKPDFYTGINPGLLPDIAEQAGVNKAEFTTCMTEGRGKERVTKDKLEGSVAGLSTTPGIVLKSAHRATIVKGDYESQLSAAISYLIETNKQIDGRN